MKELRLVFSGYPSPRGDCVFIKAEDYAGCPVDAGEWQHRGDGYVELVITELPDGKPDETPPSTEATIPTRLFLVKP